MFNVFMTLGDLSHNEHLYRLNCQNFSFLLVSPSAGASDILLFDIKSPAGSLLAVKLHSENGVIFKGKYKILISLIHQWQDNPRKTMRNQ